MEFEQESKPDQKTKSPERIRECYETALEAGIWENKARLLAEMPLVTSQFITDHVEAVLAEGKEIKLAVYRIRENWKVRWPKGNYGQNQGCEDHEVRQRYVRSDYKDWVNH